MARRHFFRRYQGRGSYDLFSSYNHFLPGISDCVMLLIMTLVGALLGKALLDGLGLVLGSRFALKYGMVITYPVQFMPPLLYASAQSRLREHSTEPVPLDSAVKEKTGLTVLACIFATMAAAYLLDPVTTLLPPMPESLENSLKLLTQQMPLWVSLLSASVFAPLFEEWICRGLVLRGLLKRMKPAAAIAISAAFFALIHLNPWQGIPALVIGTLLGYVYYMTGSLKLTMLMHCANNTLSVIFSRIPQLQEAETFMDILSPWAYWCIYAASILIVASSVIVIRREKRI